MQKVSIWLKRIAFVLFLLAYGFSLVSIALRKEHPPLIYFSAGALSLVALFFLYRFLRRREERKLRRIYPFLLCGILALLPVIQGLLGMLLEIDPFADFGHVYHGAIRWAEEGSYAFDDAGMKYFAVFPNNLGLTALLAGLFWVVDQLGSDQYYLAAVILNSLLVTGSILLCVDILRRAAGYAAAFVGAAVFLILPPYYVAGGVFYTDAMSFIFPPLLLWLHLVAREKPLLRRLPLDLLWAVCAFAGYIIKATPVIMLIAIWLVDLLQWRPKPLATQVIATVCVFALGLWMWNEQAVRRHMGDDIIEKYKTPWVGWLVMGATDDRDAFNEVFEAGENPRERSAAGWQMLGDALQERWQNGTLLDLAILKTAESIGTGTLGLADFLDDNPWNETWLHDYLLYDGLYYPAYDAYCSGIMLALVLLAMYAAAEGLVAKNPLAGRYPQPWIALLGIFMFLLAWEQRDRYFSNFYSMLIVAGVMGVCQLTETLSSKNRPCACSDGTARANTE